jgi:hypothetical protein
MLIKLTLVEKSKEGQISPFTLLYFCDGDHFDLMDMGRENNAYYVA